MIIPINTLTQKYILNSKGVPCYTHPADTSISTEPVYPRFDEYTCKEDYIEAGIKYIVPMTAKEIETREEQETLLNSQQFFVEEKFDGTRGIMHFYSVPDYREFYPDWIEDDTQYLEYTLIARGSGTYGGKRRMYDFLCQHRGSRKECIEFLKKEYGTWGSFSGEIAVCSDTKGYTIRANTDDEKTYTWSEVLTAILDLIDRGLYYPQKGYTRVFSRRESKKTGWLTENTDSVPQLRDLDFPDLDGTIIDGEMFIPNQPFKAVSSTLNCKYDKAIARQLELGGIVFHAFDILFFKGIDLRKMPLYRRKVYLDIVCKRINSVFVKNVPHYLQDSDVVVPPLTMSQREDILENNAEIYPNLAKCVRKHEKRLSTFKDEEALHSMQLTKSAYYEYIVYSGGEGVILKYIDGKYYHKRTKEYLKIKKFLTRECVIVDFTEPTREYTGKFPKDRWSYWEDEEGNKLSVETCSTTSAKALLKKGMTPVTRHYFEDHIGNIEYGVVITDNEIANLPKEKKHDIREVLLDTEGVYDSQYAKILVVGECSGFSDEERAEFTKNKEELIGSVVEIKANEIFRDTGKLRHPRYLRLRPDKGAFQCTFEEHIQ